jgi:AcrR family transcriptional regulator
VAGKREEKKARTRGAIIAAAAECIAGDGYEGANIEAIASMSGIAVGTVYNYFPSKLDVLFALFEDDIAAQLDAGDTILDEPIEEQEPTDVATRLLTAHLESLSKANSRMWREGISQAISNGLEEASFWQELEEGVRDQIAEVLEAAQETNRIGKSVSLDTAESLLFNVYVNHVLRIVASTDDAQAPWRETLRSEVTLAFQGLH